MKVTYVSLNGTEDTYDLGNDGTLHLDYDGDRTRPVLIVLHMDAELLRWAARKFVGAAGGNE